MLISRQERARICSDTELGAGNVLERLTAYGRPLDEPVLWTDGGWRAPDGSRPEVLTLGQLNEAVETYAGWYAARGVRPRDPVAVHSYSSTEFAVNFLALTALGAVPSFVNGNLPPETAREYVRRQGAVGAFTDHEHHDVLSAAEGAEAGKGSASASPPPTSARSTASCSRPPIRTGTTPPILCSSRTPPEPPVCPREFRTRTGR